MPINEVFACSAEDNLPRHRYLRIVFETDGALGLVAIVEYNRNASLCDASLATFVNEILYRVSAFSLRAVLVVLLQTYLEILCAHNAQIVDTKHKTYRVKNIGLSRSIQSRD